MNEDWDFDKSELLKPENMLMLYARGAFPMAGENEEIEWYLPEVRTIIPINNFNYPRSLRKQLEKSQFEYFFDQDPLTIINLCAERDNTWISKELIEAYKGLLKIDHIHSVEVYEKTNLIGGLYGVSYSHKQCAQRLPESGGSRHKMLEYKPICFFLLLAYYIIQS